ncbi:MULTISPECIES: ABC transporter ATP-binding protein [unclassified Actinomyces]|uniref:ABC transporter ATP-binding protein n=1 Tax=unclassified Actinomyces TaxID=2609248 RepID=UPI0020175BBD|nr:MULTISPECIES: ABC transporter ATP-binding protein [unclassified Actinomyces]
MVGARSLVKHFGTVTALDGLDLTVRAGEIHGFLGPNGAGKSTTIRALPDQLRLSSGTATVLGHDAWHHAVDIHARLAYVPGDTLLWPNLTGGERIDLLGGFHGAMNQARRDEPVERFDLDPTRRFRTYSKGNRQKVALVAALSCDVELLVLDEPTSGLDPLMEAVFQAVVTERCAAGTSVLLSSHILAEVETLCDRLTVVRSGRSVFTGSLAQLCSSAATAVEVVTPDAVPGLERTHGVSHLRSQAEPQGHRTTLLAEAAALPTVLTMVASARPLQVAVHPPSLEQLFLDQHTQPAGDDGGGPR